MTRFTAIVLSLGLLWMAGTSSLWAAEPRYGGTYRFPLSTDPPTLDPAHITDTTSHTVASEMFNGLVQYDDQLNIVPDIAERWDLSSDKRTYTFYLKKGVKFHHGRECTAADFRETFERVLHPSTRSPRTGFIDRPIPPGTLLAQDAASAQQLSFLLEGPMRTQSQAAMVFCLMNRNLATTVPEVKNVAEIEELAACIDMPPIPPSHLDRVQRLYARGFHPEAIGSGRG